MELSDNPISNLSTLWTNPNSPLSTVIPAYPACAPLSGNRIGDIPTRVTQLINDLDFVSDPDYRHTDNNFTNSNR